VRQNLVQVEHRATAGGVALDDLILLVSALDGIDTGVKTNNLRLLGLPKAVTSLRLDLVVAPAERAHEGVVPEVPLVRPE